MMLLPMLKGGNVANEWQPMSALMCSGPISRCSSFIAEKNGRSGQPVHKPDGRGGTNAASRAAGIRGNSLTELRSCHPTRSRRLRAGPAPPGLPPPKSAAPNDR